MPRTSPLPIPPERVAVVAAAADVSTRTVRRYLAGLSMHGSSMRRIARALEGAGHVALVRGRAQQAA